MEQIFNKISKYSLYLLFFLIPLWFLPITQDALNFQKQTLFIVLMLITLLSWMAGVVMRGNFTFRLSWFHILPILIFVTYTLSTIFSKWRYGSFWGLPLNPSDSFLTILFFLLLYYMMLSLNTAKEFIKLLLIFTSSILVANIYILFQLYHIYLIPFGIAKNAFFNTIGSVNVAAIITAALIPFLLAIGFSYKDRMRWITWSLSAVFFIFMILFNFLQAWIVLSLGIFVLLLFSILKLKKDSDIKWISFPMVILVISLFFIFFRMHIPGTPQFPIEVMPSLSYEASITKEVLKKDFLFGYGPGTFQLVYAKYHQPFVNNTAFWGTRFVVGASEVLDWFSTKGLVGGLSFIALLLIALVLGFMKLIKFSDKDGFLWIEKLAIVSSFFVVATASFLYYSNVTLSFFFWILLSGMGMVISEDKRKISVAAPSIASIVFSFFFLLVLIFGAGILFIGGQKYLAETIYLRGEEAVAKGDSRKAVTKMLSAASLNPSMDIYWRDLSQVYLSEVERINQDKSLTNEQKSQQIQATIINAVKAVNKSVEVAPLNVADWNVRGFVFRNLIGLQGADSLAVESYNKAIELEPSSPFAFTELGRVYSTIAEMGNDPASKDARAAALNKALENLNKAIQLKPDYSPAHYLIAVVYGQQGKSREQIAKLEETKAIAPDDKGLAFQLGVLYYQNNQLDKAQGEFERAKNIDQNYANVRYMLGLVYDRQGKTQKALDEFSKVLELNPDNNDVKRIIENIKNGKAALFGLSGEEPPVSENPPEIQDNKK